MPRATTVDPARGGAVADLPRRPADALAQRDERAFLAGLDPDADPDFVTRQRALFTNLAGVPFDQWRYLLHAEDPLDLSTIPSAGADELWAPAVDLVYALHGADPVPTSRAMGYLFARHGDAWYLRSDTALATLGRRTWRGPWDFAPCVVTSTSQGIVLAHPGSEALAARLAAELDGSVQAVSAIRGTNRPHRAVI